MEVRFVQWIDSLASNGWEPLDEIREMRPMEIKSIGFVVDESDQYVTLLQSYDERTKSGRPHGDHSVCIPKVAIVGFQTLPWGGNGNDNAKGATA